jgi:hypothetical protein
MAHGDEVVHWQSVQEILRRARVRSLVPSLVALAGFGTAFADSPPVLFPLTVSLMHTAVNATRVPESASWGASCHCAHGLGEHWEILSVQQSVYMIGLDATSQYISHGSTTTPYDMPLSTRLTHDP